jgi:hypothetical protein
MKKLFFILTLSTIMLELHAEDSFNKLYTLSENVRDIVLKSPEGHPMPNREFQLSTSQADQMKALASLDDTMRSHLEDTKSHRDCESKEEVENLRLEKRVNNRNFQIEAVVFVSDTKFEQNSLGRFMSDDYINYMGQLSLKGNSKSGDIYSVDSLVNKYKSDHPGNNLDSLKFADKEKILNEYAESYLGTKLPSGLLMKEMAFQNMVNHSGDWKTTLAAAKDKLSNEQKVELVSKLGGNFGNLYNYARANAGDKARGEFVNVEQLLDSVKAGVPGGICRDVALAQTQMLKELGFNHNYVVAYKTLSGSHATAITTDPTTGKIIKFNYSETNESKKGSGTEALIQDTTLPDHGLGFRIYDSNGKPVTHVPSELAQMLKETTGSSSDRDFTPRNFSLTNVNFKSPYVDGSLFTGKTSTGETLYGVSLYKNIAVNEYLTVGAGASLSKIEGNRSLVKMEQENLYLRTNAELTSPALKLGSTETRAFLGGETTALISNNKETSLSSNRSVEAKNELDGTADMYLGVQNTFKTSNEKTSVDSKIYANFYPDWNHVASGDKTIAAFDSLVVKTGVSHQITDDTRALIDTAVIMKNYGTSMVVKAALEDDKRGARYIAGVAAPLTKDMPTFLPGGEKRAFVGMEKMTEKMTFSIMYERNFDNRSNSVMLRGEVKF